MVRKAKDGPKALERVYRVRLTLLEPILGTAPSDKEVYSTYIASKKAEAEAAAHEGDADAQDELETLPANGAERGMTVFHQLPDGTPFIYDYHIRGFFKDACSMLRRNSLTKSAKLSAFRKIVDGQVFVEPRRIALVLPATIQEPVVVSRPNPAYVPLTSEEAAFLAECAHFDDVDWANLDEADVLRYVQLKNQAAVPSTVKQCIGFIDVPGMVGVNERPLRGQTPQGERVALAKSEQLPAGTTLEFQVVVQAENVTEATLREWLAYGRRRGLGQWRNASWGSFSYEMEELAPALP